MQEWSLTLSEILAEEPCGAIQCYKPRLEAISSDPAHRFTLADAVTIGVETDHLLWATGRLAPEDGRLRKRIIGFISDCVVEALPVVRCKDAVDALTAMLRANRKYFLGEIKFQEWDEAARLGNRGLACEFAPETIVVSGRWSRSVWGSWVQIADIEYRAWAMWAPYCHELSRRLWNRHDPKSCGGTRPAIEWERERLVWWLSGASQDAPQLAPSMLPEVTAKPPKSCDRVEMLWDSLCSFPLGARRIEGFCLEKNAWIEIPDGIEEVGNISHDGAGFEAHGTLKTIKSLSIGSDRATVCMLPESVTQIDELWIGIEGRIHADGVSEIGTLISYNSYGAFLFKESDNVFELNRQLGIIKIPSINYIDRLIIADNIFVVPREMRSIGSIEISDGDGSYDEVCIFIEEELNIFGNFTVRGPIVRAFGELRIHGYVNLSEESDLRLYERLNRIPRELLAGNRLS